jgi:hypothetical protein
VGTVARHEGADAIAGGYMLLSEAVVTYGGVKPASRALGIPETTFRGRLAKEKLAAPGLVTPPPVDPHLPIDEIRHHLRKQFEAKHSAHEREQWCAVHVTDPKPIAVLFFGDPHLGDGSCNWPLLERHAELCRTTPGLYGANIGDTGNFWPNGGRLGRLWAEQETSRDTERRLAKWFLRDAGIKWLVWIFGNHDSFDGSKDIMREMNTTGVFMQDWEAKFRLCFPTGEETRVHVAHDFPGNSQWNILHGPGKAARMTSDADLYVCGHKHDWAIMQFEIAGRNRVPTLIRVRGYKWMDDYAKVHGFQSAQSGSSILTIFNPHASDPAGKIMAFSDVEAGVEVLKAMRSAYKQQDRRHMRADVSGTRTRSRRHVDKTEKSAHVKRRSPEGQRKASGVRDRKRPGRSGRKGAVRSASVRGPIPGGKTIRRGRKKIRG